MSMACWIVRQGPGLMSLGGTPCGRSGWQMGLVFPEGSVSNPFVETVNTSWTCTIGQFAVAIVVLVVASNRVIVVPGVRLTPFGNARICGLPGKGTTGGTGQTGASGGAGVCVAPGPTWTMILPPFTTP